jgi:hypothetical protein
MGKYRKIDVRIWNDADFVALSDQGKLLWFFLYTHPHMTSIGAMRATKEGLRAELKWSEVSFNGAFSELLGKPFIEVDEGACFLCFPNFLKYNPPENPNVVKSWDAIIDLIPECELKDKYLQSLKAFAIPFGVTLRKGLANQEQEQEQEQEHKRLPQFSFETIWKLYPKKLGKTDALRHFKKTVVTEKDFEDIQSAVKNYQAYIRVEKVEEKFVKHGSTWFNTWRDWIPTNE